MKHWTISYVLNVLEAKNWSMNRLAKEAGLTPSTINRPIREKNWEYAMSPRTISKIHQASGVDPTPFMPKIMQEPKGMYLGAVAASRPETNADRVLAKLPGYSDSISDEGASEAVLTKNEIRVSVTGPVAQIVALVDRNGIQQLRDKLDAIESLLEP